MKFEYISYKRMALILLSSIVLVNSSGCSKENNNEIVYEDTNVTITPTPTEKATTPTPTETPVPTQKPQEDNYENQKIIDLFKRIELETEEIIESNKDCLEYAKNTFVTLVDFIFLGAEIDNIKFEDLSEEEKQEVLYTCYVIDSKLEEKFPNYKQNISDTKTNFLNKASELIQKGKDNIKEFTEETFSDEFIESVNQAKKDLKDVASNSWEFLKSFGIDSYEKGKQYIKEWLDKLK